MSAFAAWALGSAAGYVLFWLMEKISRTARRVCGLGVLTAVVLALVVGCGGAPLAPGGSTLVAVAPTAPAPPAEAVAPAQIPVDDRPSPGEPYRRDLWPHWKDPDRNGCDAREDALKAASLAPPAVGAGCKVTAGRWHSDYDGATFAEPGRLDVDHVVPLAEAHRSGGSTWSTDRRAQFANDPAVLWVVSAASNRAKGDRDPAAWRPPVRSTWCAYAQRWVQVKLTYGLTADTAERDALGQMLDTCNP